ncbi:MAG: PAS domain S-box protein, partial [Phocaeicola sp.]
MKNVLFFLFSHVSTSFQGMTSLSAEQYTSLASETNLSYGGDASSSSLFNSSIIVVLLLLIALVLSILYTILLRRQIKRAKKREKALSEELVEAENRNILVREVGSLAAWKFDVSKDKFFVIAKEVKDKSLIGGVPRDKFFSSLIHPDNRSEMSEVFEKMKSGLISKITIKFQFFTNDEWRWVISSFIAIRENGVLKEIIGDRRDITAEVEYEQSLMAKIAETTKQGDELLQILEDLPIPISLIKFDSKEYSFVNKLGRDEYGVQRGDSSPYKVLSSSVSKLTEEEELNGVYEAIEVLEMANGRQIETLVRSAIVEYKDEKHILISRLDLSKKEVLWRGAESTYMPNMKGYVWHLNNDTDTLSIKHNMALERDISLIKSFEEFVEIVHPEDRVSFMENVEWLKTGDLSDSREFTFRIDIHEIGVYEWWEALATVTIVMEGGKEVRLLGGIVVNIHDRKKAEIELRALHTQNEMI